MTPHMPTDDVKLRLRIARLKANYFKTADAARTIEREKAVLWNGQPITARTYKGYEHASGNAIEPEIAQQLEQFFGVRRGWILIGDGESIEDLRRTYMQLERDAPSKALEARVPKRTPRLVRNNSPSGAVNQLTPNNDNFTISLSQIVPVCRIPVLTGDAIADFCAGKRDFPMTEQALVAVESGGEGNLFAFDIPKSDSSMTSSTLPSFPPGTRCVIDINEPIKPGDYVCVRRRGMTDWMLRQYRAALPLSLAKEFTLYAINPAFEAIRVDAPAEWEIAGRLFETQITARY